MWPKVDKRLKTTTTVFDILLDARKVAQSVAMPMAKHTHCFREDSRKLDSLK